MGNEREVRNREGEIGRQRKGERVVLEIRNLRESAREEIYKAFLKRIFRIHTRTSKKGNSVNKTKGKEIAGSERD